MERENATTTGRRRTEERRRNDSTAWVLGAGIPRDRRSPGDRRRSRT